MKRINNLGKLKDRRRELRKNQTKQEKIIWDILRDKSICYKFRRQHSVGGYILDFYCADKKLVIEIDGEIHNTPDAKEYDRIRNNFFIELGYSVLRFSNKEVDTDINFVLLKIKEKLNN